MAEQSQRLETHFLKNTDFKTVLGSGFYGGFTPSGHLNVFIYTERVPIPKRISFSIDSNSSAVVEEIERESISGLVREVQFGFLLDVNTAQALSDWLKGKLDDFYRIQTEAHKQNL